MPMYVAWTDRRTHELRSVQRVDDEIREYLGLPPDNETFSPEYQILSFCAMACSGLSYWSMVDPWTLELTLHENETPKEEWELFREFLMRRYFVCCYYSHY